MSTQYFAPGQKDCYKIFHKFAYKPGVTHVYSNFTNRHNKYSNIPDNESVVFVGLQYFILSVLIDDWNKTFFDLPEDIAVDEYMRISSAILGKSVNVDHIRALHQLGYLPLEIKAVEEGTMVPYSVPSLTVVNTVEGFGWLTNMIETVLSSEIAGICTSATTAAAYRKGFQKAVDVGLPEALVDFMGHDFSYRGMLGGTQHAAMSGFGHLCSFAGSDTIPAGLFAEKYYGVRMDKELVMASVDATEHSVMCSWGGAEEIECLRHLMTSVTPGGILSVVSDTWDFWKLVTEYLPALKDDIMQRDGTLVIRPDSGDPVKILCGYDGWVAVDTKRDAWGAGLWYITEEDKYYKAVDLNEGNFEAFRVDLEFTEITKAEVKGLIECLWEIFGGEVNEGGFKMLDSHIGAIYGDSITLARQEQIINRLIVKGFVPSVVLGIGSYTYQYVTRDTHGSAVKATDVQFGKGKHVPIFKDPKTDRSKKSAKGLLKVVEKEGVLVLLSDVTPEEEAAKDNMLKPVFRDGELLRETTLQDIRKLIKDQL